MSKLSQAYRDDYAELTKYADRVLPKMHANIWTWFYCDDFTYQQCAVIAGRSVSWVKRSLRMSRPVVLAAEAEDEACKTEGNLRFGHTIHFGAETTFAKDKTEEDAITSSYMDLIKRNVSDNKP